jgi:hypothetical protein
MREREGARARGIERVQSKQSKLCVEPEPSSTSCGWLPRKAPAAMAGYPGPRPDAEVAPRGRIGARQLHAAPCHGPWLATGSDVCRTAAALHCQPQERRRIVV